MSVKVEWTGKCRDRMSVKVEWTCRDRKSPMDWEGRKKEEIPASGEWCLAVF